MNCKPGDLALVVKCAVKENIGKCVRVIALEVCPLCVAEDNVWRVDTPLLWSFYPDFPGIPAHRVELPYAPDDALMPIPPLSEREADETRADPLSTTNTHG